MFEERSDRVPIAVMIIGFIMMIIGVFLVILGGSEGNGAPLNLFSGTFESDTGWGCILVAGVIIIVGIYLFASGPLD